MNEPTRESHGRFRAILGRRRLRIAGGAIALSFIFVGATLAAAWPWTTWSKYTQNPVYEYPTRVASDPTVIKDGPLYRMIVSVQSSGGRQALAEATSSDGTTWTTLPNGAGGIIVPSNPASWDCELETPKLIKRGTEYLVFYDGYCAVEPVFGVGTGDLGLATSLDGVTFARLAQPVMTKTPGWYDNDAITDPTAIDVGGTLYLIYTGWCSTDCAAVGARGAWSMGATSTDGGRTWTKHGPLPDQLGLHNDIIRGADGAYYVYYNFGKSAGCKHRESIRRSRSFTSPFGPFEDDPTDLLCQGPRRSWEGLDFGFPAVLDDGGVGKMWYTGVTRTGLFYHFSIGLATSTN